MTDPVFSPLSVQDLDGIVEYIGRDSPRAELSFVETLKAKCDTLAQFPLLGADRGSLAAGLRAFSVGAYVIYYRPEGKNVRIERVLHGARDADALFP